MQLILRWMRSLKEENNIVKMTCEKYGQIVIHQMNRRSERMSYGFFISGASAN